MKKLWLIIAFALLIVMASLPGFADLGGSSEGGKHVSSAFSGANAYPKAKRDKNNLNKSKEKVKEEPKAWEEPKGCLITNLIAVLNRDYSVTLYNDSVTPENSFDALGMKRLSKNPMYPYFQIGLASQFSLTTVNNTNEVIDFYADGNPLGKAEENKSFPPEYYTGQGKIWSPYLWRDLRPGEHRYVDGLSLSGYMKFHFIGSNTVSSFMLMVY